MTQQNNIRMLAAVMFSDIVGYSKMMQNDEQNAKFLRDRQRSVVNELLMKYRGQVMQYYGDGILLMFGSALDAVKCGGDIQRELKKDPEVPVRIGIHIGDVMYDDEGIYGDAVNIAARVQALGIPGSVMMSGKVVNEIKNQPEFRLVSFGELELKNIYMPVEVFAMADEGLDVPKQKYIQNLAGGNPKSIAVLPFKNYSSEIENEYFSDGITEEIINALSKLNYFQVASRTSVFTYKKEMKDIREIGKELNVSKVLEGSVRMAGNKMRITAQLSNADNGFHIWSENFNCKMENIFDLQDEISKKIVIKIQESLGDSSRYEHQNQSPTESTEAYNYYLKGLYHWNKQTPETVFKAIDFFDRAVREFDTYTKALAKLANCYTYLGAVGHLPSETAILIAEKYAHRALELDETNPESHTALGYVNCFKWEFKKAELNLQKARKLNPENNESCEVSALYNRIVGNYEKMISEVELAVNLDPASLTAILEYGYSYFVLGDYEKALMEFDKALELDPLFRSALEGQAFVYVAQKEYDKALDMIKKCRKLIDSKYRDVKHLAFIYAKMGNQKKAEKKLDLMKSQIQEEPNRNLSLDFALVHAALGEHDLAFDFFQQAIDSKLGLILLYRELPILDDLRKDLRFHQMINQIGLPKNASTTTHLSRNKNAL